MPRKRVILAGGSRLLREMLHQVIDKADHLEVVREISTCEELPLAIEQFGPEWVIISLLFPQHTHGWTEAHIKHYPSVRFLFLAPESGHIKVKWQASFEEDIANPSLRDLIHLLEKDPKHT